MTHGAAATPGLGRPGGFGGVGADGLSAGQPESEDVTLLTVPPFTQLAV